MEHCLYLMKLEVWNIVYFYLTKRYGTLFMSNEPGGMELLFISTEPRGMEHCLCLMHLEVWNIVYFYCSQEVWNIVYV